MPPMLQLILEYFLLNMLFLVISIVSAPLIQARWPDWWERWIAAPYPDEFETADDYRRI